MKYNSTRNKNTVVTAAQAISQGISEEGGLFVPQELPKYSADELLALSKLDYKGRAKKILADFLSDFTAEEISESVDAAYAAEKFGGDNPAPISYLHNGDENMYILELWHGPTSAFKDMALQILPHLLTKSMHKVKKLLSLLLLLVIQVRLLLRALKMLTEQRLWYSTLLTA